MKGIFKAGFLALFASVVLGDSKVVELTDSDFDSRLEQMDTALVMFYAPWCGHCKQLKPKYDAASEALLNNDPPVHLVKVDCTEGGKDTCNRFSVSGYPTLKIFRSGEFSSDYNGPRETGGLIKYMESQVGPASKALKSHEEIKEYAKKKNSAVVACYSEDSKVQASFDKTSQKLRESYVFAHTNKKSGKYDGIVIHRAPHLSSKFEDDDVVYDGSDLSAWIEKNIHGLAGVRTHDNMKEFKEPLVTVYFDVDYVKNPKGTNYWRNRIMKVAKDYSKDYSFCVSNREDFLHELEQFGASDPRKTPLATLKDASGKKFVLTQDFSVESFGSFLKSAKEGKLEPYIKSEEIPDNSQNAVKVAVAKNFESLVTDEKEKDILIEFYAPWCGHCKKLAPVYDEVATELEGENVVLVKMDATANDVPPTFNVRGFPTLYWIKAGQKPVSYDGGRSKDDFIKYIAKEATQELKKYDRAGKPKKTEL